MALALRKEEGLGLGIAIVAHAAIVAVLLLRPQSAPVVQPPERIEVTISDEIAEKSTSPDANSQAAPPVAPTLGEPQPPEQAEAAESEPEPAPAPPEPSPPQPAPPQPAPPEPAPPKPTPPQPRPKPREVERPAPKPVPKKTPPRPKPDPAPAPKKTPTKPTPPKPAPAKPATKAPAPKPAAKAPAPKSPAPRTPAKAAPKASSQKAPTQKGATRSPPSKSPARSNAPAGGSRIGSDFLEGVTGAKANNRAATTPSAAAIGPAVKSSLASAISRQLKPRWQAPQGPGAEELVTILSFSLNRDGSLAGTPTVVRQQGIDAINRNQAARHAEQAIKAVQLAAPFDLPAQYYDAWKRVSAFRFDKRLSQ